MREKFQTPLKALLLIALALFFYSRLANGSIYFYINQRFVAFTLLAVVGLIAVGLSYRLDKKQAATEPDHAGGDQQHNPDQAGHNHSHSLTWGSVALVLLPIVLGLAVPPRPLGASALANREVNLSQSSMPAVVGLVTTPSDLDKNILDWWKVFRSSTDLRKDERVIGQPAQVIGFVYNDERYGPDHFMLTRFTVSCCVADASVLGLVVKVPAGGKLENDQWVEVAGSFIPSNLEAWKMPVLVAENITTIPVPQQPYLYP